MRITVTAGVQTIVIDLPKKESKWSRFLSIIKWDKCCDLAVVIIALITKMVS